MRLFLKTGTALVSTMLVLALSAGCKHPKEERAATAVEHSWADRYTTKPEPRTVTAFPPVPIAPAPKQAGTQNLFANPGFETGQEYWDVAGDKDRCLVSRALSAEGQTSLQVLPAASGDVFVAQAKTLKPRSFYALSALVTAPDAGEATLEVHDAAGNVLMKGEPVKGPMSAWAPLALMFVSGNASGEMKLGVLVAGASGNAPVLIDRCELRTLPTENFLPSGTMEALPEDGAMPEWYAQGKSAPLADEGYQGDHAMEIPAPRDGDSTLACLIPTRAAIKGRAVWVSAMIRSKGAEKSAPPEVTMTLRLSAADGTRSEVSASCPGSGEWREATLTATLPDYSSEDSPDVPPFHVLLFTRPAGVEGRVLVDDVAMLAIPEGHFDGGLVPAKPAS